MELLLLRGNMLAEIEVIACILLLDVDRPIMGSKPNLKVENM